MKEKIRKFAGNLLFYLALVLILFSAVFLMIRGKNGKPTYLFGHSFLWVETASMQPTIEAKSYIMVRRAEGLTPAVGDVIVFTCPDASSPVYGSLITHRIVSEGENGYRTKGDNPLATEDPWTVARGDVAAVYQRNMPVLTFLGRVLSSKIGFILVIGMFLAAVGFGYVPALIKSAREETEKAEEQAREEEISRRVAEELERLERENAAPPPEPDSRPNHPEKKS